MSHNSTLIVAVHDGQFHADDVFAVAVLKRRFGRLTVIRTRDPAKLAQADLRVDVGGKFSPEDGDFDHHQPDAPKREDKRQIPYAAFGMVWRYFGKGMFDRELVEIVDRQLVQAIDGEDCGVAPWRDNPGLKPATLDMVIELCNPMWHELAELRDRETAVRVAFDNAVRVAEIILDRAIQRAEAEILARAKVREALAQIEDPRILVMDQDMPWQKTVQQEGKDVQFVVCRRSDGNWGARAVPQKQNGFELRCPFPEAWSGKTDAALAALTGVPDATFCHTARFLAIAKSREGALSLARLALEAA